MAMARHCVTDAAVIMGRLDSENRACDGSNGDLVILIIRSQFPVTVMFRRSNQPLTPDALRVNEIIDRSTIQ